MLPSVVCIFASDRSFVVSILGTIRLFPRTDRTNILYLVFHVAYGNLRKARYTPRSIARCEENWPYERYLHHMGSRRADRRRGKRGQVPLGGEPR